MNSTLNLITLALLASSMNVMAYDFGVSQANQSAVKLAKWKCKRCKAPREDAPDVGELSVTLGSTEQNNDHLSNYIGYESGTLISGDAKYERESEQGVRHVFQTKDLGSKTSRTSLKVSKPGSWQVNTGYRRTLVFDHPESQSYLQQKGARIEQSAAVSAKELKKQRNITEVEMKYQDEGWQSYLNFTHHKRTGRKRSSFNVNDYEAYNFASEINDDIYNFEIGSGTSGENWTFNGGYLGSWYDNNKDKLSFQSKNSEQSQDMGNEAHSLFVSGQYRMANTQIVSRISHGVSRQDLLPTQQWSQPVNGLVSSETEASSTNANVELNSRISAKSRIGIKASYYERSNDTDISRLSDAASINRFRPIDVSEYKFSLNGVHRYSSYLKAKSGVVLKRTDRAQQERSRVDDAELWFGADWRPADKWKLATKFAHQVRSGSEYNEARLIERGSSPEMRKFNLADKNLNSIKFKASYMPDSNLVLSLKARATREDYKNSDVGLKESNQYRIDGDLFWQPSDAVNISLFGGYEWRDNEQLGSDSGADATWRAITDEEFGYAGTNLAYTGLSDAGLFFDLDYMLSYSESWTRTSHSGYTGDYRSYVHQLKLNSRYQLSSKISLGISYQYVNHFDNDYANIPLTTNPGEGVFNLQTLGELNNDYDAHVIKAMLNYRF